MNKYELLAASQALSIYILIRLNEGPTEDNNFDFLMLSAVTVCRLIFFLSWMLQISSHCIVPLQVISKQFVAVEMISTHDDDMTHFDPDSGADSQNLRTSWKDWIFEESRQRWVSLLLVSEHTDLVVDYVSSIELSTCWSISNRLLCATCNPT